MFRLMVQDQASNSRLPSRPCEDCGRPTRERKPFCPDHIADHGYPKRIADILKSAEQELLDVERVGPRAIDLSGIVVEEIIAGLASNGTLTWRRLLKDHVNFLNDATERVSNSYMSKLMRYGLIDVDYSSRGLEVVSLTQKAHQRLRIRDGQSAE